MRIQLPEEGSCQTLLVGLVPHLPQPRLIRKEAKEGTRTSEKVYDEQRKGGLASYDNSKNQESYFYSKRLLQLYLRFAINLKKLGTIDPIMQSLGP